MPYISDHERRQELNPVGPAEDPGELNYQLTACVLRYVEAHGLSYRTLNDVVGALESAKAEFQRRLVAPYEDGKAMTNGDVYRPEA